MRAVVQERYGEAHVLTVREVSDPLPAEGEVVVRVKAAGVDRGVWHLMVGEPRVVRLGVGVRRPKQPVIGRDLAGVVERVGSGVTDVAVGDAVLGFGKGTYAELARVPVAKLVAKPADLTFVEAAALPFAGTTALQAVVDKGGATEGQRVLVIGAGGGVGSYAVQIAAGRGCHVTAVCSAAKAERVRGLGATETVDYRLAEPEGTYDLVIDVAGNRTLRALGRLLTPRGTAVLVGGEDNGRWFGPIGRVLRASVLSPFSRRRYRPMFAGESAADLRAVLDEVAAGRLTPIVERTYQLEEAPKALRQLTEQPPFGKLVLEVG